MLAGGTLHWNLSRCSVSSVVRLAIVVGVLLASGLLSYPYTPSTNSSGAHPAAPANRALPASGGLPPVAPVPRGGSRIGAAGAHSATDVLACDWSGANLSVCPADIQIGQATYINASYNLSGSVSYYWFLPPGCVSTNAAHVVCTPSTIGFFWIWANATNGGGRPYSWKNMTDSLLVLDLTGVSVHPTSVVVEPGQTVTLNATVQCSGCLEGSLWGAMVDWNLSKPTMGALYPPHSGLYAWPSAFMNFTAGPTPGALLVLALACPAELNDYMSPSGFDCIRAPHVSAAVNVTIVQPGTTYGLNVSESGLPAATAWNISLGAQNYTNVTTTGANPTGAVRLLLSNGTWNFTVQGPPGFTPSSSAFSVTIQGAARAVIVPFSPSHTTFPLTFSTNGLSAGALWTVTIGNLREQSQSASLTFQEPNGTYDYAVKAPGYCADPDRGVANISGAAASVSISFVHCWTIIFHRPSFAGIGENWWVWLYGTGMELSIAHPLAELTNTTTNATIDFSAPNGTYGYSAHLSGNTGYNATGTVTVHGGNASVTLPTQSSPGGNTSSGPQFLGLPGPDGYLLLGGVAIALGAAVGAALVSRRRKRGPSGG